MPETGPFSSAASPHTLLLEAAKAAGATSIAAAAAAAASTRLLSDVPDMMAISVGKPPRIIDEGLKKELKQVRMPDSRRVDEYFIQICKLVCFV